MHSTLNIVKSNDPILINTNDKKDDIDQRSLTQGEQEIVTDIRSL